MAVVKHKQRQLVVFPVSHSLILLFFSILHSSAIKVECSLRAAGGVRHFLIRRRLALANKRLIAVSAIQLHELLGVGEPKLQSINYN